MQCNLNTFLRTVTRRVVADTRCCRECMSWSKVCGITALCKGWTLKTRYHTGCILPSLKQMQQSALTWSLTRQLVTAGCTFKLYTFLSHLCRCPQHSMLHHVASVLTTKCSQMPRAGLTASGASCMQTQFHQACSITKPAACAECD